MGTRVNDELWRTLKIGDRVRVVEWPWPPDHCRELLHPDTYAFYGWLIETAKPLRVYLFDEFGMPWAQVRRVVDGRLETEGILLNHGGIELAPRYARARSRKRRPPHIP